MAMPERTITRLVAQEKAPERVSVFVDGDFALGVHQELVIRFGLYVGRHLSEEEQRELYDADRALRARAAAFQYISFKPRTEHEIRQKLLRAGFEPDTVESALSRLRELGYVDDAAYAASFVRSRVGTRGYGPVRIRRELHQRGVDRGIVDDAIRSNIVDDDEAGAAREQAAKRWPRLQSEADARKRRKKLFDFLLRRGFSFEVAAQAVEEVSGGA
jgi:regulatory protein